MESLLKTVSCTLLAALTIGAVEAASLHEDFGAGGPLEKFAPISEFYRPQETQSAILFASEKFRNIATGKEISLSFDEKRSDPLRLFSKNNAGDTSQRYQDWIELVFGFPSWQFEDDGGFPSTSVLSPSSIPLPAALPLFAGGLAVFYVMMRRRRRKTN